MSWFDASFLRPIQRNWKTLRLAKKFAPYFRNSNEIARALSTEGTKKVDVSDWSQHLTLLGGTPLEVGVTDHIESSLKEIFVERIYTSGGFYHPMPGDCVVDLGAHIGLFSLYLLGIEPNLQIFAVEPSQDNYRRLKQHLESLPPEAKVETYPLAIAGKDEVRELLKTRSTQLRSLLFRAEVVERSQEFVSVAALETFLKDILDRVPRIDFLKMDIEGAEAEAIESLSESTLDRIRAVAIEVHEAIKPGALAPIVRRLRDVGFYHIQQETVLGARKTTLVRARKAEQ